MWNRDGHHNPNPMWTRNQFVPLIPIPATISTVPSYAAVMKSQPPPSKPNISQQTSVPTTHTSNSTERIEPTSSDTVPDQPSPPPPSPPIEIDDDDVSIYPKSSTHNLPVSDANISIPNTYPLPNGTTQNAAQLLTVVLDQVVSSIPKGYKDNLFCALNNENNILRRQNSKFGSYADDCGAWDTHSGRSNKPDFILLPGNVLKRTVLKNGSYRYCTETKSKNKQIYTPLNPQPDTVVTLNRYYSSLKRDKSYKKRISWFSNIPETFTDRTNIVIVEYIGKCPRAGVPHGNAKHSTQEFVHIDPQILNKIKDGISNKHSSSDIYRNLVFDNPDNAPRDSHQIRNVAYNMKKQHLASGNVADEVTSIHGFSMVNQDGFVKEVFHTESTKKPRREFAKQQNNLMTWSNLLKPAESLASTELSI
jgi:hypothetical protein